MSLILLIILFGALPPWPYSRGWGYYPVGGVGAVLAVVNRIAVAWHHLNQRLRFRAATFTQ